MDFARRQRDPTRHMVGIGIVILVHVIVIYGLVTGLARKAVEVIKKPLNATIVEEIKAPPPPPPPPKKIEIPKTPPPPQPYVPPPDIPVPTMPSEPVIAAISPTPPPAPPVIAPPAPPPPPPAKPAVKINPRPISATPPDYPSEAQRKEIEGSVVAHVFVDENGNVTDVKIIEAKPPKVMRYFEQAAKEALKQWKFAPTGEKFIGEIEVDFKLQ
ncbi:MAG TPA: energy transducer TonB [Casimicrobiaceae bacterium]|nr:energy transducer TonB [Casimicrobiaceae bacterium]